VSNTSTEATYLLGGKSPAGVIVGRISARWLKLRLLAGWQDAQGVGQPTPAPQSTRYPETKTPTSPSPLLLLAKRLKEAARDLLLSTKAWKGVLGHQNIL
jgi:hypothetical protein